MHAPSRVHRKSNGPGVTVILEERKTEEHQAIAGSRRIACLRVNSTTALSEQEEDRRADHFHDLLAGPVEGSAAYLPFTKF
jgi:hypothetical protein